jgi:EmrB/QacA subfamily drug resistance transporter
MKEKVKSHWLILVVLALAQFMVVLDTSVVNVALPAMQQAFSIGQTNLQWIVTAYTLAFGGFLLLGGRAADLYGRKKVFMTGITMFGFASLAAGLAQSEAMLIGLRGLQGLSAALMSPAALSIVLITYREGKERNTALAVWGAVASGGAAAGVLLGGVLTEYLDWRWNFFINIPVAIGVFYYAKKLVPEHESEETHNDLDLPGAISITSAMMLFVYTLVEAPTRGWTDARTLGMFAAAAALLAFFIYNEKRVKNPLMPLGIFRIRNLTGANLVMFPVVAAMFSMFYFTSLYIQTILGYSPVETGLSFIIVPVVIAIAATNIPKLIGKVGYKWVLVFAPLFIAASLLLFGRVPVDGKYFIDVFPALILLGIGAGMSFVAGTIAATSGVPGRESGLASGLLNTTQQIGGSLGLAILSGAAASTTASVFKNPPSELVDGFVGPQALHAYATVQGFHTAFHIGAAFAVAASIVALLVIKETAPGADAQPAIAAH